MKTRLLILPILLSIALMVSCKNDSSQFRTISTDVLKDKITGGWAGKHTVNVIVKGEKRPESENTNIYLSGALVFKTAAKKNETFKFSFE
jgi:hypothetical protein